MDSASVTTTGGIETFLKGHEKKELVRILTCGSVDDGKSTLIGRLLLDAGLLASDTLKALEEDSKTYGTTGGGIDPALLMDGLQAEREQGITIDVAHRYFFTDKRSFILADVPGHHEYTRNMVTAASNADLAVVLVDAKRGITEQTRRHSAIISLCGIRHVLVSVNKMDIVDFSEDVFERIREDFTACSARLDFTDLHFIPLSALYGDNVVNGGQKMMPWYRGGTLLHLLNTVHIAADRNLIDFRFPVQHVLRPNTAFRGYAGTVASGTVRPGDSVIVFPSRTATRIKAIHTFDGEKKEAFAGQAVTLMLTDEIDASRGNILAHPQNVPKFSDHIEAMVVWMSREQLQPGASYFLRLGRVETPVTLEQIRYELDVNTHHRKNASALGLNSIGRCVLKLHQPLAFDSYKRNRVMGSFILIDRITNATSGAGMIIDQTPSREKTPWGKKPKSETLKLEGGMVSDDERQTQWRQRPVTLLFTGLSGSGKSTIAHALEKILFERGHMAVVLDGENVRLGLNRDLGFTEAERSENVRRVMEVAKLLNDSGIIVLCALVSPTNEIRNNARELIGKDRFLLIHCNASLETCKKRHVKGLYAEVKEAGKDVPGVSSMYDVPKDADLRLETGEVGVGEAVERLVVMLKDRKIFFGEKSIS